MECCICFHEILKSATLKPCNHEFCGNCIQKALIYQMKCPICRQVPVYVNNDIFYDCPNDYELHNVPIKVQKNMGINIKPTKNVLNISKLGKKAYHSGLRINDIIVSINGLPCNTANSFQQITTSLKTHKLNEICNFKISRKCKQKNWLHAVLCKLKYL